MKITLEKHPELKLAHDLVQILPKAIIAGGVARDLINNKSFKDVDVFIGLSSDSDVVIASMKIADFCQKNNIKPVTSEDGYDFIKVRIEAGNLDICFVYANEFKAKWLENKFDMVSSQAWLEPIREGFEVKASDLFYTLNDKKILGIYPEREGLSGHVPRVKEKYSDYFPLELKESEYKPPIQNQSTDELSDIPF